MDRNYLNEPLADQLLGNSCSISPFNAAVLREHKRLLQEGDGFCGVSVYHPDERHELQAHAQHRYQWMINEAVQHLRLPVWHLKHQKIWFNFYSELVRRFGVGTQGYTTETDLPHIGISEISVRDPEVLQMVLLHEAQHATDYAFYDGFAMAISERELRARLSVCQAIRTAKGTGHTLHQTAALDAAQWFVVFCMSRAATDDLRNYYFTDLDPTILRMLRRGVRFSPASLNVLRPELQRERLRLLPETPYIVSADGGKLRTRVGLGAVPAEEPEPEAATEEDAPAEPEAAAGLNGQASYTLNSIDDWHNFPAIHQQLSERAATVTESWAKYEIDPSLPLPQAPPPPIPVFKSHQDLLRYKAGSGPLPLRKQTS